MIKQERFTYMLETSGLTQAQMCRLMDIDPSDMNRYWHGKRQPRPAVLMEFMVASGELIPVALSEWYEADEARLLKIQRRVQALIEETMSKKWMVNA